MPLLNSFVYFTMNSKYWTSSCANFYDRPIFFVRIKRSFPNFLVFFLVLYRLCIFFSFFFFIPILLLVLANVQLEVVTTMDKFLYFPMIIPLEWHKVHTWMGIHVVSSFSVFPRFAWDHLTKGGWLPHQRIFSNIGLMVKDVLRAIPIGLVGQLFLTSSTCEEIRPVCLPDIPANNTTDDAPSLDLIVRSE